MTSREVCPITHRPSKRPFRNGAHSYDAQALVAYIFKSGDTRDPCTRVDLTRTQIAGLDRHAGCGGTLLEFTEHGAPLKREEVFTQASIAWWLEDELIRCLRAQPVQRDEVRQAARELGLVSKEALRLHLPEVRLCLRGPPRANSAFVGRVKGLWKRVRAHRH